MFRNDPAIDGRSALSARMFQLLFPLVSGSSTCRREAIELIGEHLRRAYA